MDYHEAKYRTLWKLAFCKVGIWDDLGDKCDFCRVTYRFYLTTILGRVYKDCSKCPVRDLCHHFIVSDRPKLWIYYFDQLLASKMPKPSYTG